MHKRLLGVLVTHLGIRPMLVGRPFPAFTQLQRDQLLKAMGQSVILVVLLIGIAAAARADLQQARLLIAKGQFDVALERIEEVLAVNSSDHRGLFLKGVALAELNKNDEAIAIFSRLTREHPELPEPHNNLAVLYAAKGEYDKARDALLVAINTHPSYGTAHENLGDVYAKMAGIAYNRAFNLDVDNATAQRKLALVVDLFSDDKKQLLAANTAATNRNRSAGPTEEAPVSPSTQSLSPPPVVTQSAISAATSKQSLIDRSASVSDANDPGRSKALLQSGGKSVEPAVSETITTSTTIPTRSEPAVDVRSQLFETLTDWAVSWSKQNVNDYLGFYDKSFSAADGRSRRSWEQLRRKRISTPKSIRVTIFEPRLLKNNGEQAEIELVQGYESDSYKDRVRKRVGLIRRADGWKIIREVTIAKLN